MEWFKMYTDWGSAIRMLTDEEAGRVIKAVYAYAVEGAEKDCPGREGVFAAIILQALKSDIAKYEAALAEERKKKEQSRQHARHAAEARWKKQHAGQASASGEQDSASIGHESACAEHDGHPGARYKNKDKEKDTDTEAEGEGETEYCPGPLTEEAPELPSAEIPLNDGSEYPLYLRDVEEYAALYPAVDVVQELRKIRGWCLANPTRRKTWRGVRAFINTWLSKAQDKGGRRSEPPENPFLAYARGEKKIGGLML